MSGLVRVCKAILLTLSILSILLGVVLYFYPEVADRIAGQSPKLVEAPTWDDIRTEVLPVAVEEEKKTQHDDQLAEQFQDQLTQLAVVLNTGFGQRETETSKFTDFYPESILGEWIFGVLDIPDEYIQDYMDHLLEVAEEISQDERISRISNPQDRTGAIVSALEKYAALYKSRINDAETMSEKNIHGEEQQISLLSNIALPAILAGVAILFILLLWKSKPNKRLRRH